MATVKRRLIRTLVACAAWLTLVGGGCNLFDPAEPELPSEQAIIPDYTEPDSTLEMIARAVRDKARTNGSVIYIDAFADSTSPTTPAYHHFFSPIDLDALRDDGITPPADWSVLQERDFYIKLVNRRGDQYQFIWEPDDSSGSDGIGERTAVIHRHYRVITETAEGDPTATIAFGFADLTLVKGADGNWRISIWSDRVDGGADVGAEEVTLGRRRLTLQ